MRLLIYLAPAAGHLNLKPYHYLEVGRVRHPSFNSLLMPRAAQGDGALLPKANDSLYSLFLALPRPSRREKEAYANKGLKVISLALLMVF